MNQVHLFTFILTLVFSSLLHSADAPSVPSILIIDSQDAEPYKTVRTAMLQELARLGYQDGSTLTVSYQSLGHYPGRAYNIWRTQNHDLDAIVLNGTLAVKSFKPLLFNGGHQVIFTTITDPVGEGVILSFDAAPAYNFTGISYPVKVEKRLRFIQKVFPNAKKIGLIYADMPQSRSYKNWLMAALKKPEFNDLEILFREVEFVKSEGGHKRMTMLAKGHVLELNSKVDLFMSPNDQMGAQAPFARMVYQHASKPLLGLGRKDVMEYWGATAAIYPDLKTTGKQAANMVIKLLKGTPIKDILPIWPATGIAIDIKKAKHFKVTISKEVLEAAENNVVR